MAELDWHVDAIADLDAIGEFIARDSPAIAEQFVERIVAAADRLREHPRLGRVVPEIHQPSYRELLFQNYRVVYRLVGDEPVIIGVVHAAMDMERYAGMREWDLT